MSAGRDGHVLVIGVDGVRFDLLNPVSKGEACAQSAQAPGTTAAAASKGAGK